MPNFNLDEYELVEDRIRAFYADYPDGRIVTMEMTPEQDRAKGYWVVRAEIYVDHDDQHARCPKSTGWAFEIEGTAGANRFSALENAETSAIGRALANADYAKGKRPSQTEMAMVKEAQAEAPEQVFRDIEKAKNRAELEKIWAKIQEQGFDNQRTIRALQAKASTFDAIVTDKTDEKGSPS